MSAVIEIDRGREERFYAGEKDLMTIRQNVLFGVPKRGPQKVLTFVKREFQNRGGGKRGGENDELTWLWFGLIDSKETQGSPENGQRIVEGISATRFVGIYQLCKRAGSSKDQGLCLGQEGARMGYTGPMVFSVGIFGGSPEDSKGNPKRERAD